MKPDERTLHVLTRLRAPEFKPLIDWLTASRLEILEVLVLATDPEYKTRLQGKAEQLKSVLNTIETSPEILKKLSRTSGP